MSKNAKEYRVVKAFRVGAEQRWLKPGTEPVVLLPCEAQYPLSRGWIEPVATKQKPAAKTAKAEG